MNFWRYNTASLAILGCLTAPAFAASDYDAVIAAARAGNTGPAMVRLHQLYTQNPYDRKIVYDYIVVSTWAGDDNRAVTLYDVLSGGAKPDYVLSAAAKSYRNLKNYPKALELYRAGIAAYPRDAGFTAGEIMVLADMGQAAAAQQAADRAIASRFRGNSEVLLAAGYAAEARGANLDAAVIYQKAAQQDPKNIDITHRLTMAMGRANLHDPALQMAQRYQAVFSGEDMRQIAGQSAAQLVRVGELSRAYPQQRYDITDQAIERLNGLIADWQTQGPAAAGDIRRARFDRMVAYRDRTRMTDVIAEYEALHRDNPDLPLYAVEAAADAYLYERQPEIAQPLYQQVLASEKTDTNALVGLFYCYIETEDFDDALALADRLNAQQPPLPDAQRLRSEVLAARARQYGDDLPAATARIERVAAAVPNRSDVKTALADAYSAQGQPRRAAATYEASSLLDPDGLAPQLGSANTSLALRDFPTAAAQSDYLMRLYPENRGVQRLDRLNAINNRPELLVRVSQTYRDDDVSDVVGRGGFSVSSRLYGAPVRYFWRPFAGFDYSSDKISSGNVENQRYVGGLQYRGPALIASGEVSENNFTGDRSRIGAAANLAYDLNDTWQVGGRAELFSADTPLRALRDGVTASGGSLFTVYQPYDTRRLAARIGLLQFTDDNTRIFGSGSWVERVRSWPHFKWDWRSTAYASHNSEDDTVPYYNPKTDVALTTGPEFIHTLYRRYQFTWDHRLSLQPGYYFQENHSGGFSGNLTYQHRIRANDVIDAGLGVSLGRQLYDGDGENSATIFADLDWKL